MTLISINEVIQNTTNELNNKKLNRTFIKASEHEFYILLKLKSELIFKTRSEERVFDVDGQNKAFIRQLYYYATGNNNFNGNLKKGLFIWGGYGSGKTVLLEAFSKIISDLTSKVVTINSAKNLAEILVTEGVKSYTRQPLFIDDLGREPEVFNTFGTKKRVMNDLLASRYDKGSWTLVSAQYPINRFDKKYGEVITDRMKSMFNEIELTGPSRRI